MPNRYKDTAEKGVFSASTLTWLATLAVLSRRERRVGDTPIPKRSYNNILVATAEVQKNHVSANHANPVGRMPAGGGGWLLDDRATIG
jgi:hypothetical protein